MPDERSPEERLLDAIFNDNPGVGQLLQASSNSIDEESSSEPMAMDHLSAEYRGNVHRVVKELPISQWSSEGGGRYRPSGKTIKTLPPAIYTVGNDNRGFLLIETEFPTDELIRFPDGPTLEILDHAERFWSRKKKYDDYGFVHKMGILIHGIAGCGKSSSIKLVTEDIISRGGVVVITDHAQWMPFVLKMIREVEQERPIVNIIEDIDDKMASPEDSVAMLATLDGEHQVGNLLNLATTNYPERLEERITQRPGRFDWVVKMDLPSAPSREMYLKRYASFQGEEGVAKLKKWVGDTEGLGVAHLRGLVSQVECLGLGYDVILERLKTNIKHAPRRRDRHEVGFENKRSQITKGSYTTGQPGRTPD